MHFLTSDEYADVAAAVPMTVFPSHYAHLAYEASLVEPNADELVHLYYNATAPYNRYDADLDPGIGVLRGVAGSITQQKAAFKL
jgi:hypothetical protein